MKRRARQVKAVDPLGPTFVSYRQSDGAELATSVAWALRAMGIPVWRDTDDLPPGDTRTRLKEAFAEGLSGGVLIVTPQVEESEIIREIEAPELLRLHADSNFSLCVANALPEIGSGRLDLEGPDRILPKIARKRRRIWRRSPYRLRGVKQYRVPGEQTRMALDIARQRMRATRERGLDALEIQVQTRAKATAHGQPVGLAVRTRPPEAGARLPHPSSWHTLAASLGNLPQLFEESGAKVVRFTGSAHLTIALALGAALPITSEAKIEVVDREGRTWRVMSGGAFMDLEPEVVSEGPKGPVAVAVDLVDSPRPVDTFLNHLTTTPIRMAAMRLQRIGPVDPEQGKDLILGIARGIREFAALHETTQVHLFLRAPFPIAILLGQQLNTLNVVAYEWDDTHNPPKYVATLTLSSGHGSGPVSQVHIPA